MNINCKSVWSDIQAIKNFSPLIHNITNFVVMEQSANSLLAIGASPIMAHALDEVQEIVAIANSLILNIGTLSPEWINAMKLALEVANKKDIPVVLDPVGAGASFYRTQNSLELLNNGNITTLRGNTSEILALNENHSLTKGVDSQLNAIDFSEQAKILSQKKKCVVWMSGKTDVLTDGHSLIFIHNGHPLMAKVTGMGCTASAITGAFLAINPDPLIASAHAAILMGIAGEIAAKKCPAPGTFKLSFIDILYQISLRDIQNHMQVEV